MGSYSNRLARSLTLFLSYFLSYFSNHSKYYDYVLFYNISRRKNDFFSPFFFFYFFFDLRTWRPRARTPRGRCYTRLTGRCIVSLRPGRVLNILYALIFDRRERERIRSREGRETEAE